MFFLVIILFLVCVGYGFVIFFLLVFCFELFGFWMVLILEVFVGLIVSEFLVLGLGKWDFLFCKYVLYDLFFIDDINGFFLLSGFCWGLDVLKWVCCEFLDIGIF